MNIFRAEPGWGQLFMAYLSFLFVALVVAAIWNRFWIIFSARLYSRLMVRANHRSSLETRLRLTCRLMLLEHVGFAIARLSPVRKGSGYSRGRRSDDGKTYPMMDITTGLATVLLFPGRGLRELSRWLPILLVGLFLVRPDTIEFSWQAARAGFRWLAANRAANLFVVIAVTAFGLRFLFPKWYLLGQYSQAQSLAAFTRLDELAREYGELGRRVAKMQLEVDCDWEAQEQSFVDQHSSCRLRVNNEVGHPSITGARMLTINLVEETRRRPWPSTAELPSPTDHLVPVKEQQAVIQQLIENIWDEGLMPLVVKQSGWVCPSLLATIIIAAPPFPAASERPELTKDDIYWELAISRDRMDSWFCSTTEAVARCLLIAEFAIPEPRLREVTNRIKT